MRKNIQGGECLSFISNGTGKTLLIAFSLLFVGFVPHALAQGFVPLAPIPGLTEGGAANSGNLADFFNNLYKYLIGLAAILAIIEIIWGGLEISTQDSVSKNQAGKDRIYQALFGLVLVLSPVLVFSIINPSILNLSLNLPELKTGTGAPAGTGGTGGVPPPDAGTAAATAAGCTVTGTLFKTAKCPTQKAADDFAVACAAGPGNVSLLPVSGYKATCGTDKGSITGPYSFADTSSGIFATIFGYSKYQPIASTPSNPNNGNAVLEFASACTTDGGTTCLGAYRPPCIEKIIGVVVSGSLTNTSCWNISLSCTEGNTPSGTCDSNPEFTVVQTK